MATRLDAATLAVLALVISVTGFSGAHGSKHDCSNVDAGSGDGTVSFAEVPPRPPRNERTDLGSAEDGHFTEGDEPPMEVQGNDLFLGSCLERRNDRLTIVGGKAYKGSQSHAAAAAKHAGDATESTPDHFMFLASDLCAMGHTTKDPAHMASWLLDYHEMKQADEALRRRPKAKLTVIYGNVCMNKDPSKRPNKRSPVFHAVLLGWFRALIHGGTHDKRDAEGHQGTLSALLEAIKDSFDIHNVRELWYEDVAGKYCPNDPKNPFTAIIKRDERWRWLRTREHTAIFRRCLLDYYNVGVNGDGSVPAAPAGPKLVDAEGKELGLPDAAARRRITVTVLRRDEDRHFNESGMFKVLQEMLPPAVPLSPTILADKSKRQFSTLSYATEAAVVVVQLVTFDNIRGKKGTPPPPHPKQLQILYDTDVLIAAHGAGLAGVIAMRPGTAVVELFPHNFRYYMYQELAQLASLLYIAVESPVVWPPRCCSGRGKDNTMPEINEGKPSLINGVGARACKKCDIKVTDREWRSLLRTSINYVLRTRAYGRFVEDLPLLR